MRCLKLWQQIFLGMALGILAGILLQGDASFLRPIGTVFINLIKMVTVPLIFFAITSALTSMKEASHSLGRIGGKILLLATCSTAIAVILALVVSNIWNPASGILAPIFHVDVANSKTESPPISELLMSFVPTNPIKSMAEGNSIQIIVFAMFFAVAVNAAGNKARKVSEILSETAEVIYSLIGVVMKFAPIGVFALIGWVVGTQDVTVLHSLIRLVFVVTLACILHTFVVYGLFILTIAKLNPLPFFRKVIEAQIFAFSTASSSATLPISMRIAETKLGISKSTTNFVLPLGSAMNMDGTAIYIAISVVFIAGLVGYDLSFADHVTIVVTATIAGMGTTGIPGMSLALMSMVLAPLGLPIEGIAIVAGVDRLLDMVRTTCNVTGDLTIALIVDASEKGLDKEAYQS